MKVENNVTVLCRSVQENRRMKEIKDGQSGGKTIFAGNMQGDFSLQDRIQQRIERAQKRAQKVFNDAWNGDRKMDEEIGRSRDKISELKQDNKELTAEIGELARQTEELMEGYQVKADSTQQKELELLKKENASKYSIYGEIKLTKEEREQIAKIRERGLSEYQTRVMALDDRAWETRAIIFGNDGKIMQEDAVIQGIHMERAKVHPIADARDRAEDIMNSARDDVIGMVIQDSKDHLDEEQEKREEESEKIEEKKEEMEELLDKREEKEEEMEELIKDMPINENMDQNQVVAEMKRQIEGILSEMNVAIEDIKGAQIDKSI